MANYLDEEGLKTFSDLLQAKINIELTTKAKTEDIPTKVSQLENDNLYASESYVKNAIAEAELSGGDVDLSGYATKDELNAKASIADMEAYIEENKDELKGDKGDTGSTGPQGPAGADGYTPVKGTDYYTAADKAEMVTSVTNSLPIGDLTTLTTTEQSTLVGAINEVDAEKVSQCITVSGIDINTIEDTGFYFCMSCTNTPGNNPGYLFTQAYSNQNKYQRFKLFTSNRVYERSLTNGTWSSWEGFDCTEIGLLANLTTTDKSTLVKAINEVNAKEWATVDQVDKKIHKSSYKESLDLDTINDTCFYYVVAPVNSPIAANGYVFTQRFSDDYLLQTFTPFSNTTVYKRVKVAGEWQSWTSDEKNHIFLTPSSDYVVQATETQEAVPFDNQALKIGSKLTLSDGKVVIGAGVSTIRVSLTGTWVPVAAGTKYFYIYKNNERKRFVEKYYATKGQIDSICCADWYITNLQEGDTIEVRCYATAGDKIWCSRSHLSIEVIE